MQDIPRPTYADGARGAEARNHEGLGGILWLPTDHRTVPEAAGSQRGPQERKEIKGPYLTTHGLSLSLTRKSHPAVAQAPKGFLLTVFLRNTLGLGG